MVPVSAGKDNSNRPRVRIAKIFRLRIPPVKPWNWDHVYTLEFITTWLLVSRVQQLHLTITFFSPHLHTSVGVFDLFKIIQVWDTSQSLQRCSSCQHTAVLHLCRRERRQVIFCYHLPITCCWEVQCHKHDSLVPKIYVRILRHWELPPNLHSEFCFYSPK